MVERLQNWLKLASERYKGQQKLYISPGNDDRFIIDDVLKESLALYVYYSYKNQRMVVDLKTLLSEIPPE